MTLDDLTRLTREALEGVRRFAPYCTAPTAARLRVYQAWAILTEAAADGWDTEPHMRSLREAIGQWGLTWDGAQAEVDLRKRCGSRGIRPLNDRQALVEGIAFLESQPPPPTTAKEPGQFNPLSVVVAGATWLRLGKAMLARHDERYGAETDPR